MLVMKALERVSQRKARQELMAETAAKVKEQAVHQKVRAMEYKMLRIGHDCGHRFLTVEELHSILEMDPQASDTVYGRYYAMRSSDRQKAPTPLLLAETPGDTAQLELLNQNYFELRNRLVSTATLPVQGQAG